ncbi:PAS domain S-box-containing protein/diguanylate cyclase (GGDEF) domain-containing protein [Geodermatophilus amargosae]|uniref:PAS domain S-box-containing protein/diguanylate cyclase (GGDEF) domain-containing protein n=1 Tax=Geodermatophilus amargosae TaxID=1296565 RepID=A0A1I7CHP8_9ACTN|nr:PAS domain S-box-containing protein/diguanylate cyclase (GGDEF) domain-containing protein [Geodermatophilus amargosae]
MSTENAALVTSGSWAVGAARGDGLEAPIGSDRSSTPAHGLLRRVARALPSGRQLPDEQWEQHHRFVLRTLAGLTVAVLVYALVSGHGVLGAGGLAAPVAVLGLTAALPMLTRGEKANVAAVGLMTAAAVVVHISGGRTEAHFLFFALLPLAALYATPVPFVMAVGFVALHHFLLGSMLHGSVFPHGHSVLQMSLLHAVFILIEAWACFVAWRRFEDRREFVEQLASDRTAQLHEQRDQLVRLAAVVQSTDDAVFTATLGGLIETWNPGAQRLYGYTAEEVLGRHVRILVAPGMERLVAPALAALQQNPGLHIERLHQRKDGSVFEALLTVSAIRGEDGELTGHAAIARDVTEQKRAQAEALSSAQRLQEQAGELRRLALHDPLTGLANRALLRTRLEAVLSARRTGPSAVLLLDLDDFKAVNDVFGHGAGDAVLTAISGRLQAGVRPEDTVARLGGDEFVVLIGTAHGRQEIGAVAERLIAASNEAVPWGPESFEVGCSIGITLIDPADDRNPDEILRDADIAMYAAKGAGRNRFEVFEPAMHEKVVAHSELVRDLRSAAAGGQFFLLYQPQVDLRSGRVTGVEALARWQHPHRGLVLPDTFIAVAEDTGAIDLIDDWALEEACRQLAAWDAAGLPSLQVAINISARRLARGDLAEAVRSSARAAGVDPARLEIEITETATTSCAIEAARALEEVRALGVSIAIDDFGMGHSSFGRLRALPVDRLKIDRSFIAALEPHGESGSIAGAMVAMGGSLGLDVVAEGVETEEQLEVLRRLGCDAVQGYLFGRPMPAEAIDRLLRSALSIDPLTRPTSAR